MKLVKYIFVFATLVIFITVSFAQDDQQRLPDGVQKSHYYKRNCDPVKVLTPRVDPAFWFTGMHNKILEICIHDNLIADFIPNIQYLGVKLIQTYKVANPNYLFLKIEIATDAKPGSFNIILTKNKEKRSYPYELKERNQGGRLKRSWGANEVLYLAMPDRFSNGDTTNDVIPGYTQKEVNRKKMYFRHGGDLKGIENHIDYLTDLGITALWLNPVIENDQAYESYHGYAFTDQYAVDKRFGSMEEYKKLINELHSKGIKIVQDMVYNHVGDNHWFIRDLPDIDWIHQETDTFRRSNYRDPVLIDPYASQFDKEKNNDGWFDYHMPDLNQKNPRLANYLIQNTIWWIEYCGIDALRIDTYAYPDQHFMADWGKAIADEYPDYPMFAETWVSTPVFQSHFADQAVLSKGFETYMPSITDFQLAFAIQEAFTKEQEWDKGVTKLYFTLAQDALYKDANKNVTFLDNHDKSRFFSEVNEDIERTKSAFAILFTTRGIPSLYYGSELLFKGKSDPDGKVRQDFPGGWKGDQINKFTTAGRTSEEESFFSWMKKLIAYRKENTALQTGKLTQFIPESGIYTYFRYNEDKIIMVVSNTHNKEQKLSIDRFREFIYPGQKIKDIFTGQITTLDKIISIKPYQTYVFELVK